jgi:hypothetical protein
MPLAVNGPPRCEADLQTPQLRTNNSLMLVRTEKTMTGKSDNQLEPVGIFAFETLARFWMVDFNNLSLKTMCL